MKKIRIKNNFKKAKRCHKDFEVVANHIIAIHENEFYDNIFINKYTGTHIRYIGPFAFANCFLLNDFTLESSPEVIDHNAFESCVKLKSFKFNDTWVIGSEAFRYSGIEKVEIGPYIRTISNGAFSCCQRLTEVDLGKTTVIEHHAFSCTALYSIVFNKELKKIGNRVFEGCIFLHNIVCLNEEPPRICENTFYGTAIRNIWVPSEEAIENYSNAKYWSEFKGKFKVIDWKAINEYITALEINRNSLNKLSKLKNISEQ